MASGKMVGGWMSGELLKFVERRCSADFEGNQSAYVVSLVEADRDGVSGAPDASIVVALARRFQPTLASSLEQGLVARRANQARVIARFLEALDAALHRETKFNPAAPFEIYTDVQRADMDHQFHATLEELLRRTEPRDFSVNEAPTGDVAAAVIKAELEKRERNRGKPKAPKRDGAATPSKGAEADGAKASKRPSPKPE